MKTHHCDYVSWLGIPHNHKAYGLCNTDNGIGTSLGPVAQWIRHRPTEPGIAGSSPAGVIIFPALA